MRFAKTIIAAAAVVVALCAAAGPAAAAPAAAKDGWGADGKLPVELGPRPLFLINAMKDGPLKTQLQQCQGQTPKPSDFSIGHRGAALMFPEHTRESYIAGAQMGARVLECDATFTKDKQLVCRHSQCDLHTTTNILAIPELAAKCSEPFSPADPATGKKASAKCCASDITLAEYKQLCGKMDASNAKASTVDEYLGGTAAWRTDLYATCGAVMTHAESIELFKSLGTKFTPELKSASVAMPFQGDYSQEAYAQQLINEYKAAGVKPEDVFAQSFNLDDVLYWIKNEPAFGRQAVFLDESVETPEGYAAAVKAMPELAAKGVKIYAPPLFALVKLDENKKIVPSELAVAAKAAGLQLITWTLERSGPLKNGGGWYFMSIKDATTNDGVYYELLDVLARDVGVLGVFSDWPATVTYYANCMGK